jgi:hypothetical protein
MSERERGNDSPTGNEGNNTEEEMPPSEPRESEEGQRQADEPADGTIDAGTEREQREEHPDADAGEADTHGGTEPVGQRETAPQSDFTTRQVGIGIAVLAVGLIVAFALPLLLA